MNKKEVAKVLEEIGTILELKGDNPFKIRAYYNGARILETLDIDLTTLTDSGKISEIKGIGKALADKITTLATTGNLPYYQELKVSIPEGLLNMMQIPGLGAKKVKIIYDKLGLSEVGELEYACKENRLRDLQGFGQKSQDKILQSIELQKRYSKRFLYSIGEIEAEAIVQYLKECNELKSVDIAGSLRRKMETVKDLDIISSCQVQDRKKVMRHFVSYEQCFQIKNQGITKSAIVLNSGITAEIRLVQDHEYPFLLHHATGSKEHNTHMRQLAKEQGYKLNEYGLFRNEQRITCKSESEIFKTLGLAFIPPELRENMGEIEAAREGKLPNLYEGHPFTGIFHVHTTYSDGANTIEEIATACQSLGFAFVGICDHSKSAFYANGLTEERVLQQQEEINRLNSENNDFRILKGIEVDILHDGSLDFDDSLLSTFDFVIASVHSQFKMNEEIMTNRLCAALKNPYVTMLGHPSGRLLLAREPYALNMEKVIEVAGEEDKIVEINTSPYRLDLDWRWGKYARANGVMTVLNPDAHSVEGLTDYKYGIGIARKGWYEAKDILNTYSTDEVIRLLKNRN
jgi:DNA polymerase (family 10)